MTGKADGADALNAARPRQSLMEPVATPDIDVLRNEAIAARRQELSYEPPPTPFFLQAPPPIYQALYKLSDILFFGW